MAFSVNDAGVWKTVKKLSVHDGTWKTVQSGWINKDGVWTKFYSNTTVPGAPTITSITVPNYPDNVAATYFVVNYNAPADNGNTPVTQYEYSLNGGVWTNASLASPVTVTGLSPGVAYSVILRAVNAVGSGNSSNAVAATPAGRPFSPTVASGCSRTRVSGTQRMAYTLSTTSTPYNNGGSTITLQYNFNGGAWANGTSTTATGSCGTCGYPCTGGGTYCARAVNEYGAGPSACVATSPCPNFPC